MAIYDNNPTFTFISWKNMIIDFEGDKYPIANHYSNKKYLYWDASQPYQLIESNERKKEIGNRFLLIINNKGLHTLMPNDAFKVLFDGDSPDLMLSSITSIYESIDGIGDKFVNIETDIDGIKQTVGDIIAGGGGGENDGIHNAIIERVSAIEQKADSIDLSVKEVTKQFADNKETLELREKVNKSIIDYNTVLGVFKSDTTSFFKDSKISSEEKDAINIHLDQLDNRKAEILLHVNVILKLLESQNQTDKYNALNSSKTKFLTSVLNLRTYITTAISDNTIVPSEITAITDLFGKCSGAINVLKNDIDTAIYLGAGGSISEELARIGIRSDKIELSVSKTEEEIKKDVDLIKQGLESQIGDVSTSLGDLEDVMNTTFKDGIISEVEREMLNERIATLDKEKEDVDSQYEAYYSDSNLTDPVKSQLKTDYDKYASKHSELKSKIQQVIEDNLVNEAERIQIDTLMKEYATELAKVHTTMNKAIDNIAMNKAILEVEEAKKTINKEIDDIKQAVGDLETNLGDIFLDGVINEAEAKILENNLIQLDREKLDVDVQYKELYNNKDLL